MDTLNQEIGDFFQNTYNSIIPQTSFNYIYIDFDERKVHKIMFLKSGDYKLVDPKNLDDYINRIASCLKDEYKVSIMKKWQSEIKTVEPGNKIDLGLYRINLTENSPEEEWYQGIVYRLKNGEGRKFVLLNVNVTQKVVNHLYIKKNTEEIKEIQQYFSLTSPKTASSCVKVDFKTESMEDIFIEDYNVKTEKLPYKWSEFVELSIKGIRKEDVDRFYFYTSLVFLKKQKENDKFKFSHRSLKTGADGKFRWYSTFINIVKNGAILYTIDETEEITKHHLMEGHESIKEDRYKHAILSDAMAFYEFNITKNKIIGTPVQRNGDRQISLLKALDLSEDCTYQSFIEAYSKDMVETEKLMFLQKMDLDYLKECYIKGEYEVWFEYYKTDYDGEIYWARNSIILTKDDYSDDIIGLTVVKNITDDHKIEEEKIYNYEVINGLSKDYSNVLMLNLKTGIIKPIRFTERNTSFYKEFIGENAKYEDAIELYIETSVYDGDKDMLYMAFSRENMKFQLARNESFYVNYRAYINNKLEYNKLKVVRIGDANNFSSILFGIMNVDDEIEHEMQQKKLLEDALNAAEKANDAKTKFLSSMSHDIRTPMNAIIGFTTLAQTHTDDISLVTEYLGKIKSSSSHLLSLINDILDMSRIESGKLKIKNTPCNMDDIIEEINDVMFPQVQQKNLTYIVNHDTVKTKNIWCDKLRLNQILINMLGNAVKYTNETGTINFTIAEMESTNPEWVQFQFTVKDNGIGMSKNLQEHIFEPFTREDNAQVEKIQGTGLGMSITKSLVDLMDGTIVINSELGKGTEILISLKFKVLDHEETRKLKEEAEGVIDYSSLKGKNILLAEDNEFNREIAVTLLGEYGLVVDTAEDGQVAVNKMEAAEPDKYSLILMDVMMPVMNGYEATQKIRKLNNEKKAKIPIIAMTANAFEEDKKHAIDSGMNSFVSKPFDMKDLLRTLKKYIDE